METFDAFGFLGKTDDDGDDKDHRCHFYRFGFPGDFVFVNKWVVATTLLMFGSERPNVLSKLTRLIFNPFRFDVEEDANHCSEFDSIMKNWSNEAASQVSFSRLLG
jgi:hypothetical protein